MIIAVAYDDGMISPRFGKAPQFKLYTDEYGEITKTELVDNPLQGHAAIAKILADKGTEVVICGGIGDPARDALHGYGMELYTGNTGDPDLAVKQFLACQLNNDSNGIDSILRPKKQ